MKKLILSEFHAFYGAQFITVNNWAIPESYSDPVKELEQAIHTGPWWITAILVKFV